MTERLYYDDSYITEFDAIVEKVGEKDGKRIVALNRSAFYPTSGGQPYDTGKLNEANVTDVFVDKEGEVWHEIDGKLFVGEAVHGSIDWLRRFDHMQQHGGEHMIAGAFYQLFGGMTIGLHLGAEVSSIDVELPNGDTHISDADIERIEDYVNLRIWQDHPIKCWFPDEAELAELPLRKRPTVTQHIRIVAMGDFEMVACGGTHPSSTGQIGLVKIVDASPAKGKLRVSFVCGKRAFENYRSVYHSAWSASNVMATRPEKLKSNIEGMAQKHGECERRLHALQKEKLLGNIPDMLLNAENMPNGGRLISGFVEADMALLRDLASKLIENADVAVLLGAQSDGKYNFVFARGESLPHKMGAVLSQAAKTCGGKGGGRPDFAQGGGPKEMLDAARQIMLQG